ncbi:MAG: amino acid racemase [Lachnospiraceae bacterium]|nr:amino acid racemase [Lachnospiraceae bacterium]
MKKLGLIGGIGPESTLLYYHDIVYGVQEKCGLDMFPHLTIESVNVYEVLRLCTEKKYEELTAYLLGAIQNLKNSGADFAAISANTPHIVFGRLQERSPLPLVSIVEATREEALRRGLHKIGLLGTIITMTGEFFKAPFAGSGVDIVTPTAEEMDLVNLRIASELEKGIVKEETLREFQQVIERMRNEDGIEAVVLGCTEIPLLLNDEVSPVPCLDTVKIHVESLVEKILE